jgi:gamma-glutamyltranspeptidase/glutathione hydrolase
MVASACSRASAAGLQVLKEGGNAFDAALAMALVEGVTLPWACGLGGDMFCTVYHAPSRHFWSICGSGAAPVSASVDAYRQLGYSTMPSDGPLSASVPGALDAYLLLHERFASLPWARLCDPAVALAENGVIVTPRLAGYIDAGKTRLARFPSSAAEFLPHGRQPTVGSRLHRPHLTQTLRTIMGTGRIDLYEGQLGTAIVNACSAPSGLLTADDLARHRTRVEEPLRTEYRGLYVYQPPLPSQGLTMLEMLNILECFSLSDLEPLGDQAIHLITEAKKLAFADRNKWSGDPRFVDVPVERLISKSHAREQASRIDHWNTGMVRPARGEDGDSSTTFCCAIDAEGNAVSLIHSLASNWGSAFVVDGTGIVLNNRAGRGFSLDPNDPNCLAPSKRTMHTLNCCMLADGDEPVMMWGTPGGDLGLQWNVQTLLHVRDNGIDPQSAVEMPRWHSVPGTDPSFRSQSPELLLEQGVDEAVLQRLGDRGHNVRMLPPWSAQTAMQLIAVHRQLGIYIGASDPRAEGQALGY